MGRFAAIADYSDDAIIAKMADEVIMGWNPPAERMSGHSSAEFIGQFDRLLSLKDRAGEITAILARIKPPGMPITPRPSASERTRAAFPGSLSVSPTCDADGAAVGAFTISHDVTKQSQAFDAARSMIESSLDSLASISADGTITDANEATVRLTGIPRGQLIGTAFSDCFTDPEKADEINQLVFAQGVAVDYSLTMRHRDGALTGVVYNASVYRDIQGNVLGVFAVARDVTKQIHAQREVADQQARQLQRLAELERFQLLTVGRELKMVELKKEIESLRRLVQLEGGGRDDWG